MEVILDKIGAPKGSTLPLTINYQGQEILVDEEKSEERIVSLKFTPAYPFKINDMDLFEHIEEKNTGDRILSKLILADPKTGRIWKLNTNFKVMEYNLIKPWETKSKLIPLKDILKELANNKIKKKKTKKQEIK